MAPRDCPALEFLTAIDIVTYILRFMWQTCVMQYQNTWIAHQFLLIIFYICVSLSPSLSLSLPLSLFLPLSSSISPPSLSLFLSLSCHLSVVFSLYYFLLPGPHGSFSCSDTFSLSLSLLSHLFRLCALRNKLTREIFGAISREIRLRKIKRLSVKK